MRESGVRKTAGGGVEAVRVIWTALPTVRDSFWCLKPRCPGALPWIQLFTPSVAI